MSENEPRKAKQIICMRTDLNMRKGKMVAQGSHASLGVVLLFQQELATVHSQAYSADVYHAYKAWITGTFTKICVSVSSEAELLEVFAKAESAGLPVKLITDAGLTEFNGVPTKTCLAIGPAWADDIDKITGHLSLL